MRELWIGTSWKMNKTLGEAVAYAVALRAFVERARPQARVFVAPPFTALGAVCAVLRESPVLVGAQTMHWADDGPFTGEISPLMVKDCGARLVELGHSERRAECGETDATVNRKVLAALRHGLRPLVCVGETAPEKERGLVGERVGRQVATALGGVPTAAIGEVLFAYEPVWAIGAAGAPAEPAYVDAAHARIRDVVAGLYGDAAAECLPVLYGGGVDRANAAALVTRPHVDGLFVGRAAWDVATFAELIDIVDACGPSATDAARWGPLTN